MFDSTEFHLVWSRSRRVSETSLSFQCERGTDQYVMYEWQNIFYRGTRAGHNSVVVDDMERWRRRRQEMEKRQLWPQPAVSECSGSGKWDRINWVLWTTSRNGFPVSRRTDLIDCHAAASFGALRNRPWKYYPHSATATWTAIIFWQFSHRRMEQGKGNCSL